MEFDNLVNVAKLLASIVHCKKLSFVFAKADADVLCCRSAILVTPPTGPLLVKSSITR